MSSVLLRQIQVKVTTGDTGLDGRALIFNTTPNAFAQPAPGLERMDELFFFVGNSFFNQNWVTASKGLTAIGYLIFNFELTNQEITEALTAELRRMAYLVALTENLHRKSQDLWLMWSPDGVS